MNTRDVGDRVNIGYEARDPDTGQPLDTDLDLTVTKPDGSTLTPGIEHPATGIYHASFDLDAPGLWSWKWTASGALVDVSVGQVLAADPAPLVYADLAEFKAMRRRDDNADDTLLMRALSRASRAIDRWTGRRFYLDPTPTDRVFEVRGRLVRQRGRHDLLLVDDIGSAEGLRVYVGDGLTWSEVFDFETYPDNAHAQLSPITGLRRCWWGGHRLVKVTARWGWPAIPEDISGATLLLANRLYMRKDSYAGVVGSSEWGAAPVARLDPDVEAILQRYALPGVA